jgi:cytochrome c oxidase assembly protein subunit 15
LPVAVAHAGTAQALVCVMVAMALFTNPKYGTGPPLEVDAGHPRLALLTTVTTVAIFLQILIGAVMRHLGAGLAIPDFPTSFGNLRPPFLSLAIDVNFAHRCGAVVVSILVLWMVTMVFRRYRDRPELCRPALLLIPLLMAQVTLGALTVWSGRSVIPTTLHVTIGAVVLATTLVLTIRLRAPSGLALGAEAARVRSPISPMERKVTA